MNETNRPTVTEELQAEWRAKHDMKLMESLGAYGYFAGLSHDELFMMYLAKFDERFSALEDQMRETLAELKSQLGK